MHVLTQNILIFLGTLTLNKHRILLGMVTLTQAVLTAAPTVGDEYKENSCCKGPRGALTGWRRYEVTNVAR